MLAGAARARRRFLHKIKMKKKSTAQPSRCWHGREQHQQKGKRPRGCAQLPSCHGQGTSSVPPGAFGSLLKPRTAAGGRGKQSRNQKGIPLISCWMLEELPAPASGNRQRPEHPRGISAGEPRGARLTRSCCLALPDFLSIHKDRRMKGKPLKQQEGLKGFKISS